MLQKGDSQADLKADFKRKKKRIGFSPSSNHCAGDLILAPSVSLEIGDARAFSKSLMAGATRTSPDAEQLCLTKQLIRAKNALQRGQRFH